MCKEGNSIWYGLRTLNQLWYYLRRYQRKRQFVRLVTANTAYGIQPYQKFIQQQNIMLFIGHIPDLMLLEQQEENIIARCSVPIQQLRDLMESLSKACEETAYEETDQCTSYPPSVAYKHWKRLATTEVRNVGSIGGNLFLAKKGFPSDLFIVLATLGATVTTVSSTNSRRELSMMDFLLSEDILAGTDIIYEVKIPFQPRKNVFMDTYKVSKRPQNSHPLVNAGFSVKVAENKFQQVKIFFGNITNKGPREMTTTEKWMTENCTRANLYKNLHQLLDVLHKELSEMATEDKKYVKDFRVNTACNIFFKYLVKMAATFHFPHWNDIRNVNLNNYLNQWGVGGSGNI